jgi:hypothetical protein
MTDYYPLIAKAVVGQSSGEARRTLYDRARSALVAQLRSMDPPLPEADITRERLSLDEAIRKVETEAARRSRGDQPARPAPPPRPDAPPPPAEQVSKRAAAGPALAPREPPVSPGIPVPPEVPAPPPRRAPPGGPPASDRGPRRDPLSGAPPPPRAAPASKAAPAGSAVVEPPPVADFGSGELRAPGREPRPAGRRGEPPSAPPFFDTSGGGEFADSPPGLDEPLAPPPGMRGDERARGAPPRGPDSRREQRPDKGNPPEPRAEAREGKVGERWTEPTPQRARQRPTLPLRRIAIAAAAVLILLTAVAVGLWNRSAIVGYFGGTPAATRTVDTGARPKIADRIGGSTVDDGAPVGQKVVLYEEDPNDAAGKRYVGTAVWRLESIPPAAGKPPDLAIRADIDIPDQKITARWSLRRNDDKTLPASHTVEVMFTLPPDFPHKGITSIPGVLMKQSESTRGVPLAGLAVKVTNNFFLIGLSSVEGDRARNIQLLKERGWFDIPLVYEDGRRAIIAIEKGTPGERAFARAFEAWGQ